MPVFRIPEIHRPPVLRTQLGGSGSEEVGQLSWNSEIFRNCCEIERLSSESLSPSNSRAAQFPAVLPSCTFPTASRSSNCSRHLCTSIFVPAESTFIRVTVLGARSLFFFFFSCSRACFFVALGIAKGQLSRSLGMLTRYSGILSHQTKSAGQQDKVFCLFTRKLQAQSEDHFLLYRNLGFRSVSLLL